MIDCLNPAEATGLAIADVLLGLASPAGRLPFSWPTKANDVPPEANYTMARRTYRYAQKNVKWSFGHGLSFSTFEYTALQVRGSLGETSTVTVSFTLRNVAGPAGKEVAQLYLSPPAEADEPPQLLRAFEKVLLRPQEQVSVSFSLTVEDVRVWDTVRQNWRVVPGRYGLGVGSGSRDVRLRGSLVVDN